MFFKSNRYYLAVTILIVALATGCNRDQSVPTISSTPALSVDTPISPTYAITPTAISPQYSSTPDLSDYAFPESIDEEKQYLFYLHGKIIEDQGIPAISPEYGEYEYGAILEKLSGYGLVVISETRPQNTVGVVYARKITEQIESLLDAGVPAKNITVLGASKGAGIAVFVSHYLKNKEINFILMAICNPETIEEFRQNQIFLYGKVLSIFDSADSLAGSCQELFSFSEGKGISSSDEVILNIGTGHGILYQPLDEWIIPAVRWAGKP